MPVARLERIVNAPHAYVWDWLADFGALDKLHPPGNLVEFSCEGNTIGARRFARFKPELGVDGQSIEAGHTKVVWEGHYTEHGLPRAEVDGMLKNFYELFLGNIEKAHALGRKVGESPY